VADVPLLVVVLTTVIWICNNNYYKSFRAFFRHGKGFFGRISGSNSAFLPHCWYFATKIITKMLAAVVTVH
jgi:hypothetical protein